MTHYTSKSQKRWVEAAILLSKNPSAQVQCPEKLDAELLVFDVTVGNRHVSRYLACPACKAVNVMAMTLNDQNMAAPYVISAEEGDSVTSEMIDFLLNQT